MKKLNLQLGSIKEMLTKEQMKKVVGGYHRPMVCTFNDEPRSLPNDTCTYGYYNQDCGSDIDDCDEFASALCASDPCCKSYNCEIAS